MKGLVKKIWCDYILSVGLRIGTNLVVKDRRANAGKFAPQ